MKLAMKCLSLAPGGSLLVLAAWPLWQPAAVLGFATARECGEVGANPSWTQLTPQQQALKTFGRPVEFAGAG